MDPPNRKEALARRREEEEGILARTALRMAGFRKEDLVHALERTREALDATTSKPQVVDGRWMYSEPVVDHAIRLEAADRMMKMVPGAYAPKQEEARGGNLVVEVVTYTADGNKVAVRVRAVDDQSMAQASE